MSRKNDYKTKTQSIPTNLPPWVKSAVEDYIALRKRDIPILSSLLQIWESPTGTDSDRKTFLRIYYQCLPCDKGMQIRTMIAYSAVELDHFVTIRSQSSHWASSLGRPPLTRWRGR